MTIPTIVIDLSGGVVQVVYAAEPVNVIVISHDSDDITAADEKRGTLAPDGKSVAVWSGATEIDSEVVEHYIREAEKP